MNIIAAIVYLSIIILTTINIIKCCKRRNFVNTYSAFSAGYCLYYGIVPILAMALDLSNSGKEYVSTLRYTDGIEHVQASVVLLSAYLIFYLIYNSFSFTNKDGIEQNADYNVRKIHSLSMLTGITTLVVGGLALLVIFNALGGLNNAIIAAKILRAYGSDNSEYIGRNILFVRTLMPVLVAAPIAFYIAGQYKRNFITKGLFLFSTMMAFVYLIFNAGRAPIIIFVIPFLFLFLRRHSRHPWRIIFIAGLFGIFLLPLMSGLFHFMSFGEWNGNENVFQEAMGEFIFPYVNVLNMYNMSHDVGYRFGLDYFTWIINMIPSSVLNLVGLEKVPTSHYYTSLYYDPFSSGLGGTPTDFITFGYRQFGFLGIFVHIALTAVICRLVDAKFERLKVLDSVLIGILRVDALFFMYAAYADIDPIFRGKSDILVIMFLLFFVASMYRISKACADRRAITRTL